MKQKTNLKKIQARLKIMGRIMTKRKGLNVHISGNQAFHTENSVYLPAGAADDIEYLEALEGFNDHEFGHHEHSKECLVLKARKISTLCERFQNGFEDVRMEQLVMNEWPGSVKTLNNTIKWCLTNGWFPEPEQMKPASLVQMGLLYRGRAEYCNQTLLSDYAQRTWDLLQELLPEDIYQGLEAIHQKLGHVVTEQDALDLALEALKLFEDDSSQGSDSDQGDDSNQGSDSDQDDDSNQGSDSDQDDDDSNQGSDSDQGDDDSSQGSDSGQGDDDSSQGSDSGQGDDDSSQGSDSGQGDDDSSQGSDSCQGGDDSSSSQAKQGRSDLEKGVLQGILDALPEDLVDDFHELIKAKLEEASTEAYREGEVNDLLPIHKFPGEYSMDVKEAKKASFAVRRALQKGLFDRNHKPASYDRLGDSFDQDLLAGVPAGNIAIFKRETLVRKENAAVSILIDRSGSMGYERMEKACKSALALAYALDAIPDVRFNVGFYPYSDPQVGWSLNQVVGFSDKLAPNVKRFGVSHSGGTPTGEAINSVVLELSQQQANKKLLFVITDGDPNCPDATSRAIAEANALGIQVVGFGINTDRLLGFEACGFVVIDDVATLHKTVGQALKEKLF
ncbi:vWA domain-containing protein [Motilimonas eburnea]|uniref:vWA domain-containing protein n=1 Tax=Motilimonas eburnea TaxID=1737488 RepID=UPI001E3F8251|nr:vWA domain-containing protein [Motilimonas eburnea]MCE2571694.1 VWA domain-containing protein [Motilimonas eburnea]